MPGTPVQQPPHSCFDAEDEALASADPTRVSAGTDGNLRCEEVWMTADPTRVRAWNTGQLAVDQALESAPALVGQAVAGQQLELSSLVGTIKKRSWPRQ